METAINSRATNLTQRNSVKVVRNIDGTTCKVYSPEEWDRVSIVPFTGGQQVNVHTATEFETWHHAKAFLVTPEAVPTSLREVAEAVESSARKREVWCVLQVGHDGVCLPTMLRDGSF